MKGNKAYTATNTSEAPPVANNQEQPRENGGIMTRRNAGIIGVILCCPILCAGAILCAFMGADVSCDMVDIMGAIDPADTAAFTGAASSAASVVTSPSDRGTKNNNSFVEMVEETDKSRRI